MCESRMKIGLVLSDRIIPTAAQCRSNLFVTSSYTMIATPEGGGGTLVLGGWGRPSWATSRFAWSMCNAASADEETHSIRAKTSRHRELEKARRSIVLPPGIPPVSRILHAHL